jgi:preprotein translocase subunit SecD
MRSQSPNSIPFLLGVVLGGGCAPAEDRALAEHTPSVIELRMVEEIDGEGTVAEEFEGATLYLSSEVIISENHIDAVRPSVREGNLLLDVTFTEVGEERMRALTAQHVGGRMALLVDGQVRSAPVIAQEIILGRRSLQVAVPATVDEADSLAERIRSRWPQ